MAKHDIFCNRAAAAEAHDDIPRSPEGGETIGDIIVKRYSRRDIMRGTLGVAASAALFGPAALAAGVAKAEAAAGDRFDFEELNAGIDANHHVAPGYRGQVLLRWGDPLFSDSPPFNPTAQSAAAQLKQFGYNNDYVAFFPLDDSGKRGLLCVNHEYTNEEVMFPGISKRQDTSGFEDMTAELVDIEMAAHGVSIVEIARAGEDWRVVLDSPHNRRISPGNTEMKVDGPAAGDARLKTSADPTAKTILGTLNNCAGGKTPWGTSRLKRTSTAISGRTVACLAAPAPRGSAAIRPRATHATAFRASGRPGASSMTGSMSTRSRTSRTASAGSWRSIRSTLPPFR